MKHLALHRGCQTRSSNRSCSPLFRHSVLPRCTAKIEEFDYPEGDKHLQPLFGMAGVSSGTSGSVSASIYLAEPRLLHKCFDPESRLCDVMSSNASEFWRLSEFMGDPTWFQFLWSRGQRVIKKININRIVDGFTTSRTVPYASTLPMAVRFVICAIR